MAYSECLLTRLNPLAERACFSQASSGGGWGLVASMLVKPDPAHFGVHDHGIEPGTCRYKIEHVVESTKVQLLILFLVLVGIKDANSGGPGGPPGPLGLAIASDSYPLSVELAWILTKVTYLWPP
jgi:hypothetical protein